MVAYVVKSNGGMARDLCAEGGGRSCWIWTGTTWLGTGTDSIKATSLQIWSEEAFELVRVFVPHETGAEAIKLASYSEYGHCSAIQTGGGVQAIRISNKLDHGRDEK
ncbi:hypothetical protein JCM8547_007547 [Rhodosporidiobolus lusitaniae]